MTEISDAKWRSFQRSTSMNGDTEIAEYGYARICVQADRVTTIDSVKPKCDELMDFLKR